MASHNWTNSALCTEILQMRTLWWWWFCTTFTYTHLLIQKREWETYRYFLCRSHFWHGLFESSLTYDGYVATDRSGSEAHMARTYIHTHRHRERERKRHVIRFVFSYHAHLLTSAQSLCLFGHSSLIIPAKAS